MNIRHFSVKCGSCDTYQTLSGYTRRDEVNVYTYECEDQACDPAATRTLIEVHHEIDEFANRDPEWRGGGKHGDWGSTEHTE